MRKDENLPKVAVWSATGKCNMNCKYCYGLREGKDVSTEEAKRIIAKVAKGGVKKFVFSGGEPLLRKDISELVKFAKERGMETQMNTNGILLDEKTLANMGNNLDVVNLPLDGTEKTHAMMRGRKTHFAEVKKALGIVSEKFPEMRISVTTVVSKKNRKGIAGLARFLSRFRIWKWRLHRFIPIYEGALHKEEFGISKKEFEEMRKGILKGKQNAGAGKKAAFYPDFSDNGSYFLISPDGKFVFPEKV